MELGLDAQVNPWVNIHTLILFEEDETDPPEFDEAIITLANPEASPFSLAAARQYVPFGHYDSAAVSDPLTLEIGETRETTVQLGYTANGFQALAYAFNGDTRDGGDDHIDSYGLALGYSREAQETGPGFDAGLSWINNLADSDTLQDAVTNPNNLVDTVAGWSAYATLRSQGSGLTYRITSIRRSRHMFLVVVHRSADRQAADAKMLRDYLHTVGTGSVGFGQRPVSVKRNRPRASLGHAAGVSGFPAEAAWNRSTPACVRRTDRSLSRFGPSAPSKGW